MKKSKSDSYFKAIPCNELPDYGERILQVGEPQLYENADGRAVFLCEVAKGENEE